jgi:hypothetical protein
MCKPKAANRSDPNRQKLLWTHIIIFEESDLGKISFTGPNKSPPLHALTWPMAVPKHLLAWPPQGTARHPESPKGQKDRNEPRSRRESPSGPALARRPRRRRPRRAAALREPERNAVPSSPHHTRGRGNVTLPGSGSGGVPSAHTTPV